MYLYLIIYSLALMFWASEAISNNAYNYSLSAKGTLFSCRMTQKILQGASVALLKSQLFSISVPPLLITLTSLAYCLIHSQMYHHIFHVSTNLSRVGIRQSIMQQTEKSVMQRAETLVYSVSNSCFCYCCKVRQEILDL